jgi:hydroxyethylthiazole kinase-like uncharacterized protein yjeF
VTVRVLSGNEAAELDASAIAGGHPSRGLMQAAGEATAHLIVERFPLEIARGVAVFAGSGNNGGDAWVVAGTLAARGVRVRVYETAASKTPDAAAARNAASAMLAHSEPDGTEGLVVDGLLGTGASGPPRDAVHMAIVRINEAQSRGARVVALDTPSGVDATSGETAGAFVRADLTVTFATMKRGLLVNRAAAGAIAVVDIGLTAEAARFTVAPPLMDATIARRGIPPIRADAHKGTRGKILIVGGAYGMAGATVLAARAALRSGAGMVRLCVAAESVSAVQAAEPAAMATHWPETDAELAELLEWATAVVVGPGIGRSPRAHTVVEGFLSEWRGPVVVDADALFAFTSDADALGILLDGRPSIITPHVVEFARLAGVDASDVQRRRFSIAGELAVRVKATVLLKGVPTIISDGTHRYVSAAGTPVLATAGSGDVLSGIVATLLAQSLDANSSAAIAAWIHGRAAEIAGELGGDFGGARQVRGVTLDDVLASLTAAWRCTEPSMPPPILAELSAVGERE